MRIAVIDIGSNAIRTAVYDDTSLGAAEIYNEKFKNDIISLLEQENLSTSKHSTYNNFSYFIHIFNHLNVKTISCVATEILRNHNKAQEFIEVIKQKYNIEVQVLSGEEEARITAIGLISSIPDASGIAADLGGGSLELAEVHDRQVFNVKSLKLGTKVLYKQQIDNVEDITIALKDTNLNANDKNLYLIGGAFTLIGRCYMDYTNCIVKSLHNLVIIPEEFISFLHQLESLQKFQQIFKQYKINRQAILIIKGLIQVFAPCQLVISTYGLKEGVRFNLLSKAEQKKDLVLERCFKLSATTCYEKFNIEAYKGLYNELRIGQNEFYQKLFLTLLIFCQSTEHIDRNYHAESLVNFVLITDIPFNQLQRAILIVAIAYMFSNKLAIIPKPIKRILNKQNFIHAQIIGSLTRICFLVDGPILLAPSFNINLKNRYLEIVTNQVLPRIIFEKICEYLKVIGITRRYILNDIV